MIAIDLPRRRIYINSMYAIDAYCWLYERWDEFDMMPYSFPLVPGEIPLVANNEWTLEFGDNYVD